MGKPLKRKNKKSEKRKKRAVQKKKAAIKSKTKRATIEKRLKEFPGFYYKDYDKEAVSDEFVSFVKNLLNRLNFNDTNLFKPTDTEFFKLMKQYGFNYVIRELQSSISDVKEQNLLYVYYTFFVGQIVYGALNQQGLYEKFIPYNNVDIIPQGNDFVVEFNGLLWGKTEKGKICYSPKEPKITIDGQDYLVAFSNHVIERICIRCVKDWTLYAGAGDVFAFLNGYSNFELVKTEYDGKTQYFLALYDHCKKGLTSYRYVDELLNDNKSNETLYYRVGYCPIALNRGFAVAKTLLIPGMRGTPENLKMKNSDLSLNEQKRFEELANLSLKNEFISDSENWLAIKWYHENGISQVIDLKEDPFGYANVKNNISI